MNTKLIDCGRLRELTSENLNFAGYPWNSFIDSDRLNQYELKNLSHHELKNIFGLFAYLRAERFSDFITANNSQPLLLIIRSEIKGILTRNSFTNAAKNTQYTLKGKPLHLLLKTLDKQDVLFNKPDPKGKKLTGKRQGLAHEHYLYFKNDLNTVENLREKLINEILNDEEIDEFITPISPTRDNMKHSFAGFNILGEKIKSVPKNKSY